MQDSEAMRASKLRWPAGLAAALLAQLASAACTIAAQPVFFGSYNPLSAQSVDSTGNVSVVCLPAAAYNVSLSPGSGPYASRTLANGSYRLNYNLYTDAARTVVWGDGS